MQDASHARARYAPQAAVLMRPEQVAPPVIHLPAELGIFPDNVSCIISKLGPSQIGPEQVQARQEEEQTAAICSQSASVSPPHWDAKRNIHNMLRNAKIHEHDVSLMSHIALKARYNWRVYAQDNVVGINVTPTLGP
eukprot:4618022-Pleurochrysis_carterae.AAC.1